MKQVVIACQRRRWLQCIAVYFIKWSISLLSKVQWLSGCMDNIKESRACKRGLLL